MEKKIRRVSGNTQSALVENINPSEIKTINPGNFILENIKEYAAVISADGRFTYINPSYRNIGYIPDNLIEKKITELIHPDDSEGILSILSDCSKSINSNNKYETAYRFLTKSGSWINLESSIGLIHQDSVSLIIISRDLDNKDHSFNELKEWADTFDTFVAKFDINGFMLFCNASLLRFAGITENDIYGKYFPDSKLLSHSIAEREKIIKCFNNSRAFLPSRIECTFMDNSNKTVPVIFNCQPVLDINGNIKYITGEGKTIIEETSLRNTLMESNTNLGKWVSERTAEITKINTKLKEYIEQHKIAEEENMKLAAILKESPYPILTADADGKVIYKNPAAHNVLDGLGFDSPYLFLPKHHVELIHSCLKDNKTYSNLEVRIKGHVFSWAYNPMPELNIIHMHGLDITDQKYLEEKLLHETLHDKLTGLPNRSFFYNELVRSIKIYHRRTDYQFAVLFMDLGKFKQINDTMGHLIGDKVIIEVASRLSSCLRPEDTAARFGGDEFVILLNNIEDENDPIRIAERIQKNISAPLNIEGNEILPTASIGIVISNSDYIKPEDLIKDANTAMYAAKGKGVSQYVIFNKAIQNKNLKNLDFETKLQNAFEHDELRLFYQPIISLDTGKIVGFEALVRWLHPRRGLVSPDEFIPAIEETGQIIPIGEWIMRKACNQIKTWHNKYPDRQDLYMSVNLSAKQFMQSDFIDKISAILKDENLHPGYLNLEITESIIVSNHKKTNSMLTQLREMDVQISIDDFGIAYSSLSNLHRFPVQTLKIDRSFIKVMDNKEWTSIIPNTIISLANHLEMDVIAEGVETAEQLNLLKNLDCGYAQGNYFSPPVENYKAELLIAKDIINNKIPV